MVVRGNAGDRIRRSKVPRVRSVDRQGVFEGVMASRALGRERLIKLDVSGDSDGFRAWFENQVASLATGDTNKDSRDAALGVVRAVVASSYTTGSALTVVDFIETRREESAKLTNVGLSTIEEFIQGGRHAVLGQAFDGQDRENFPGVFEGKVAEFLTNTSMVHEREGKKADGLPCSLARAVHLLVLRSSGQPVRNSTLSN